MDLGASGSVQDKVQIQKLWFRIQVSVQGAKSWTGTETVGQTRPESVRGIAKGMEIAEE